ncbi:gamma-sarcoglycan-like isoform X2 [Brevipalpus obovatus]|uniref:gamma-sarcoglycan-like isoform X2 n=1 Tax=Brevipalpus obovatus TaxID=246614 RepID=UPI003D9EFEC6
MLQSSGFPRVSFPVDDVDLRNSSNASLPVNVDQSFVEGDQQQWNSSVNGVQMLPREDALKWKRSVFYLVILVIVILSVFNSLVTLWIMIKIGLMSVPIRRVNLFSWAKFSHRTLDQNKKIEISSEEEIVIKLADENGRATDYLKVTPTLVEVNADGLDFLDEKTNTLFQIDKEGNVHHTVDRMRLNSARGVRLDGSIQTPHINSHDNGLTISSLSRQIRVRAASGISVKSSEGSLFLESGRVFTMKSTAGRIHIDSSSLDLSNLRTVFASRRGRSYPDIMSLCSCTNGVLYMAPSNESCRSHSVCDESIAKDD